MCLFYFSEEMSDISDEHTTRVDDSTEHTESQQDTESKNIGDEHTTRVDNSAENKQHTESQQDTESKKIVVRAFAYHAPVLHDWCNKRERELFYLTTHSTHFIYGYMASDIW